MFTATGGSDIVSLLYSDNDKVVITLFLGGYYRYLLVDTSNTTGAYFRIGNSTISGVVNYSINFPGESNFNFTFNSIIKLTNVTYNSTSYPVYGTIVTPYNSTIQYAYIFAAGLSNNSDKSMLISIIQVLPDNSTLVYYGSVDKFGLSSDGSHLLLDFKYKHSTSTNIESYNSSISLSQISSTITSNVTSTSYDIVFELVPTIV